MKLASDDAEVTQWSDFFRITGSTFEINKDQLQAGFEYVLEVHANDSGPEKPGNPLSTSTSFVAKFAPESPSFITDMNMINAA